MDIKNIIFEKDGVRYLLVGKTTTDSHGDVSCRIKITDFNREKHTVKLNTCEWSINADDYGEYSNENSVELQETDEIFEYDKEFRLIRYTEIREPRYSYLQEIYVDKYKYDKMGRLTSRRGTFNDKYSYDEQNRLKTRISRDEKGRLHVRVNYLYDDRGNLISEEWTDNRAWYGLMTYEYDSSNKLIREKHRDEKETFYVMDYSYADGRKSFTRKTLLAPPRSEILEYFRYDENGNLQTHEIYKGLKPKMFDETNIPSKEQSYYEKTVYEYCPFDSFKLTE